MSWRSPYPHGADLSVYPTVAAMREAYIEVRYRDYPRGRDVPLGAWPFVNDRSTARAGVDFADTRIRAHGIVVVPGKVVVLRFARRATLGDLDRLERERGLIAQTPELEALRWWRIEARLVYCDAFAGIEAAARVRSIRLALYLPALLLRWRDRAGREPGSGIHARAFDPVSLRAYVERHERQPGRARKAASAAVPGCLPASMRKSESQPTADSEPVGGRQRTTASKS